MSKLLLYLVIISPLLLSGCSSSSYYGYDDYDYSSDDRDYKQAEGVTSETWTCTEDCSGHEAGYEWAEEHSITDPSDCGGNSDSFIEGCEAYANEYQQSVEEEYDEYEDESYDYMY